RRQSSEQSAVCGWVENMVARGKFGRKIAALLEQADLKWTVGEFTMIWIVAVLILALVGIVALAAMGFLIGLAVGFVAPYFYISHRAKKRQGKFLEQLSDMAQMMGNSMRAGFSIIQSMEMVSQEGPSPSKEEFERVITEVK